LLLCNKYSSYPILSVLIFFSVFFFVWPYSGIRQGMAICIGCYYVYECGARNMWLKMIIMVVFLSQIHMSALFIFAFFAIYRIGYNWQCITILGLISATTAFLSQQIIDWLSLVLPFGDRILFYQDKMNETSYLDEKTFFRFLIFLISVKIYFDFLKGGDKENARSAAVLVSSFFIYILFKSSEIMAAQLSIYGFYAMLTVLPNYVSIRTRLSNSIKFILVILFVFGFFNKTYLDMIDLSEKNSGNIMLVQ